MIIVTGGTGFIGSNLVAALEESGEHEIVICDTLGMEDKWRNIAKRELRTIIHPDEIFEYIDFHKKEIEAIFHLGAISATTEKDADLIVETNIVLTQGLWEWCAENGKRFIYASSAATYGDGDQGFKDEQDCDSLSKLRPLNAYGWSKHMIDRRVARIEKDGIEKMPAQWAGLKFFNVYGPNEYHKDDMMSVVCKLYPKIVEGEIAYLFKSHRPDYEDGGQLRDFVYVKDCINVMMFLYKNKDVSGLFNVGTGKAQSFKELAEATFKAAGKEPKIEYIDMPDHLREKYQYYTEADMTKLRAAGYKDEFMNLEEGVKDYVENYMSKEDKYR